MKHSDLDDTTLRCTRCHAWNYPFASFCISCGQPFSDQWDDAGTASTHNSPAQIVQGIGQPPISVMRSRMTNPRLRWEAAIGLLILLLTVGYAVYNVGHTNAQMDAYKAGIAAAQHKD